MMRSAAVMLVIAVVGGAVVYAYRTHNAVNGVDADASVVATSRLVDQDG